MAVSYLNDADGAKVGGDLLLGGVRVHAGHENGVLLCDHVRIGAAAAANAAT